MITLFATGGTFDKIYFDTLSEFSIGEPQATRLFDESNITEGIEVESVLKKDSIDLTDEDRLLLRQRVSECKNAKVIITHGTDTMVDSAKVLAESIKDKTIVFVGAMQPALMKFSDAPFNLGFALASVQLLPVGTYITMNGNVFPYDQVFKNREKHRFESK